MFFNHATKSLKNVSHRSVTLATAVGYCKYYYSSFSGEGTEARQLNDLLCTIPCLRQD